MMMLPVAEWILFTRVDTLFFTTWVKSIHQDRESGNLFFIQAIEKPFIFKIFKLIQRVMFASG